MNTITRDELKDMLDRQEDFLLMNVLPIDIFDRGHIPGSINIPLESEDFLKEVDKLVSDKDQKIVTYCASLECPVSTKAAQKLEAAGFRSIFDYKGGIKDWQEAQLPVQGRFRAAA